MSASSIPRSTASAPKTSDLLPLAAAVLLLAAGCAEGPNGGGRDGGGFGDGGPACQWDDSTDPLTAAALTVGQEVEGWLCPIEDEDWYAFDTNPNDHLITVSLCVGDCQPDVISPVEPTYAIVERQAGGTAGAVVATPPAAEVGGTLNVTHCTAPGSYFVVVRDQNDDAQDVRRPYRLSVQTAPDPDPVEPNDDAAGSIPLTAGTPVDGTIACRGDEDWYRIDVPSGFVLQVTLTAPVVDYQPTVRLMDDTGQVFVTVSNPAGAVRETDLQRLIAVRNAGTWYLAVSDDDGGDADPSAPYTFTASLVPDNDPNEPNNHPDEATGLNPSTCTAGWSGDQVFTGSFGAAGDVDWYRLPLSGCGKGVFEAELELDTSSMSDAEAWEFQSTVQASLALVRPHTLSPCSDDSSCVRLQQSCSSDFGCAGYFNACMPDGLCAGASVCLAEDVCGATMIQRQYRSTAVGGGRPPPNRTFLSAPLMGDPYIYIRAADFQSDGAAPDIVYTLRVRVRDDPDPYEPSNVYTEELDREDSLSLQASMAAPIVVHDCTPGVDDCCTASTWVTGAISYEVDQDWFSFQHPCPNEDCTLRMVYDTDGGPTEFLFALHRGTSLWFDRLVPFSGGGNQAPQSGAYGGSTAADECFYAYRSHGNTYNLRIRDFTSDSSDWSSDQMYRFCLEKISNVCLEPPCRIYTEADGNRLGCGQP